MRRSTPFWRGNCPMPKSASARISWWIRRMDWTRCAQRSATFWPRSLRCRSGEPDSPVARFLKSMREIVLDTETTGLDPLRGDRLVEIGCIEILNRMPTGQTFHRHLNPERDMPAEAFAVHGLSSDFLADKPLFAHVVEEFLEFIADAPLVIHNASFDVGFLNAELERIKRPPIARERLVDTLLLARRKHPGVSNRLDDLCSRYAIDNSRRTKHGALLDAELLAEVYIDLIGARQSQLILASETRDIRIDGYGEMARRQREIPLTPGVTEDDRLAHRAFIATLGDKPIWNDFLSAAV